MLELSESLCNSNCLNELHKIYMRTSCGNADFRNSKQQLPSRVKFSHLRSPWNGRSVRRKDPKSCINLRRKRRKPDVDSSPKGTSATITSAVCSVMLAAVWST